VRVDFGSGAARHIDEGSDTMRFGLFGGAEAPRTGDADPSRGFREYIEINVEAERLGFHSTFLVEHHFSGCGAARSAELGGRTHDVVAARDRGPRVALA
jgi:alkanesulfonate monooxygenase SsuD/methylene tetrahydromethanopterin reductase-like flavin-dependent oxidoreductase (luciferase family)